MEQLEHSYTAAEVSTGETTLKNGLKEIRKLDTGTDGPAISLLDTDPTELHACTRRKPHAGTLAAALVTVPTGNHPNAHQQVNG